MIYDRALDRVGRQQGVEGDALAWVPRRRGWVCGIATGDPDLDGQKWIRRGDRPVASRHDPRPRLLEGSHRIQPPGPLRADQRRGALRDRCIGEHPEGLEVREHAELREAGNVGGIDELEMGHLVAQVRCAVRGPHGSERVQPLANRAVSDGVHVDLEPRGVEPRRDLGEPFGGPVRDPPVVASRLACVIWLEQRGRTRLEHAVEKKLRSARAEATVGEAIAQGDQLVDLRRRLARVGRLGSHHLHRQRTGPGCFIVGLEDPRVHVSVLDQGDPEGMKPPLADLEALPVRAGLGWRDVGFDQIHGGLAQGARWLLGHGVALDPAERRIRGVGTDVRRSKRGGVQPRRVPILTIEYGRPVRYQRVELLFPRAALVEERQGPAAAQDPFEIGGGVDARGDRGKQSLARLGIVDGAGQLQQACLQHVNVRVDESGHHHLPRCECDGSAVPAEQRPRALRISDEEDLSAADRHGLGDRGRRNHRPERPDHHQVGLAVVAAAAEGHHRQPTNHQSHHPTHPRKNQHARVSKANARGTWRDGGFQFRYVLRPLQLCTGFRTGTAMKSHERARRLRTRRT